MLYNLYVVIQANLDFQQASNVKIPNNTVLNLWYAVYCSFKVLNTFSFIWRNKIWTQGTQISNVVCNRYVCSSISITSSKQINAQFYRILVEERSADNA